ncbi:putative crooked neck family 1 protein isoform 2, partial [Cardiosporidium cionae]
FIFFPMDSMKSDSLSTGPALMKGGSHKFAVKNKTPAAVQITAEQLLLEAVQRQADDVRPPSVRIVDQEELQSYRIRKRKEYEDTLRRQRHHMGTWIAYAQWEAAQKEFRRSCHFFLFIARSIFERALNLDYQNTTIWQKYIEMEIKNKFINSARNLYDRVCQLLPRVDHFWFKYAHMEELLSNYAGARSIFERWMEWNPDDKGWMMYIRFEERCGELERCRQIFERYLSFHPTQEAFLRFSKFEEQRRNITRARAGFEKAIELLPAEALDENFYIKFAKFEERQHEKERVT